MKRATLLAILAVATPRLVVAAGPELRFLRDGTEVRRLDRDALTAGCPPTTVGIDDPYYASRKTYRAMRLACVLTLGFGDAAGWRDRDVVLRARDGYERPTTAARLLEDGGYVAVGDVGRTSGWEPLGRAQVDPGPFYVVWARPEQADTDRWPWPYQLADVEITDWVTTHPHTAPRTAAADSAPWKGFALFRERCVACHAVNGEGGRVGPDLNIPQSVVEYWPEAQLKRYIRDPSTFRYGNMPSHPDLTDADLDALIAYFRTMKTLKYDPHRQP